MKKLIAQFEKNPTIKNAQRLTDYLDRHPMARLAITTYEQTWLEVAQDMIDADGEFDWQAALAD